MALASRLYGKEPLDPHKDLGTAYATIMDFIDRRYPGASRRLSLLPVLDINTLQAKHFMFTTQSLEINWEKEVTVYTDLSSTPWAFKPELLEGRVKSILVDLGMSSRLLYSVIALTSVFATGLDPGEFMTIVPS